VTHIWSADSAEAERIARTCGIDDVVSGPEELIGAVDAVILPYDEGSTHLSVARPFLSEGIPVLVDKPLADNLEDACAFRDLVGGSPLLYSCSALRYSQQVLDLREGLGRVGEVRLAYGISRRQWMKYGVHLLEIAFAVLGRGIERVQSSGEPGRDCVALHYADGRQVVLLVHEDLGPMLHFGVCGTEGRISVDPDDWFFMFRRMLQLFLEMVEKGVAPLDLDETLEIITVLVAGQMSAQNGRCVIALSDLGGD
jgi:predicted dehydrogenase